MVTSEVAQSAAELAAAGFWEEIWTFMGYLRAYETEENTNFRVLIKDKFVQKCN